MCIQEAIKQKYLVYQLIQFSQDNVLSDAKRENGIECLRDSCVGWYYTKYKSEMINVMIDKYDICYLLFR